MTLSYHAYRLQTNLHAEFDGNRQRIAAAELAVATVERTADGIAVIAPSDLMTTFRTQPADAWAMLAELTPAQLTIQAIDTACYLLEVEGRDIAWGVVLETWTTRLAVIATAKAEAEQLAESYAPYTVYQDAVTAYTTAQAEPFPGDEPIIGTPEPVPSFSNATLAYAVQVTTSTSVTRYRLDNSYEEAVLFMGAVSGVCPDRPDPVLMRRLCVLWSELFSTPEPTADTADDARIAAVTRYVTAQAEPFPGDDEAERDAATVRLLQGEIQYPHIVAAAKMALARAIANQTTRIVRRFVNTVTLDDGSVWDDEGHLLIGPYSPPRDVADAFEEAKEQAKETNQPVSLSFIYRA